MHSDWINKFLVTVHNSAYLKRPDPSTLALRVKGRQRQTRYRLGCMCFLLEKIITRLYRVDTYPQVDPAKPVLVAGDPERFHERKVEQEGGIWYHDNLIAAVVSIATPSGTHIPFHCEMSPSECGGCKIGRGRDQSETDSVMKVSHNYLGVGFYTIFCFYNFFNLYTGFVNVFKAEGSKGHELH